MEFDDLVDVPKQPVVRESFIFFFTKKETVYLSIFLTLAIFSIKIPLPIILRTFLFGIIVMFGWFFIFYRLKGRNFDQWLFDYLYYKLKTFRGNRLVWQDGYSFKVVNKNDLSNLAIWKRILITMPVFGLFLKKHLIKKEDLYQEPIVEDIVFDYENDYEINDLEEQIKGILNLHFYYEWQNEVKRNKVLERADASTLLLKLEALIEKNIHIKNN